MRKLVQLSGLMLALLVAPGCGDDDDDDDDDDMIVDASVGTPDGPDGTPGASAENLGQPCAGAAGLQCAGGEICVVIPGIGSQSEGFCTISCTDQGDTASCSKGYPGGGTPSCTLDDMMGGLQCAVLCNPKSSGECAPGTVCTQATDTGICTGDE